MARIKVTGYIDTADLDSDQVDLNDKTGLSARGFEDLSGMSAAPSFNLETLDDLDFELEA